MSEWIAAFQRRIEQATEELLALTEEQTSRARPGKWSSKEVLGHLIDSAANNHQRFVRAQLRGDLVFPGYDQDAWVRVQHYGAAPWAELVELWRLYNRHLLRVFETMPAVEMTRVRARHSLDTIAFKRVPASQPTTVEYMARDYVAHLEYHLKQILAG